MSIDSYQQTYYGVFLDYDRGKRALMKQQKWDFEMALRFIRRAHQDMIYLYNITHVVALMIYTLFAADMLPPHDAMAMAWAIMIYRDRRRALLCLNISPAIFDNRREWRCWLASSIRTAWRTALFKIDTDAILVFYIEWRYGWGR